MFCRSLNSIGLAAKKTDLKEGEEGSALMRAYVQYEKQNFVKDEKENISPNSKEQIIKKRVVPKTRTKNNSKSLSCLNFLTCFLKVWHRRRSTIKSPISI